MIGFTGLKGLRNNRMKPYGLIIVCADFRSGEQTVLRPADGIARSKPPLLYCLSYRLRGGTQESFIAFPVDISVGRRYRPATLCQNRAANVGTLFK